MSTARSCPDAVGSGGHVGGTWRGIVLRVAKLPSACRASHTALEAGACGVRDRAPVRPGMVCGPGTCRLNWMCPWPRLASACRRCRRRGEKSRTGGSPSLPSWVGSALPRDPIRPAGPAQAKRGEVTDGRQPVPTLVGRVRAAARPHLSCGPAQAKRGEVTDGQQPVPTLVGRVRAAARPHLSCGPRSSEARRSHGRAAARPYHHG